MGCGNCSSGGCGSSAGCGSNGSCGTCGVGKLDVFNWLAGMELPYGQRSFNVIEVSFKNTRKEYFRHTDNWELAKGEPVVVEAASGYDIGVVSLTGELVKFQLQKRKLNPESKDIKRVLRKPSQEDLDKWHEARGLEHETMLRSRLISQELKLSMKISDVEYQADRSKATFFYTADDRVDFRELIRVLAEQFKLRIEMRQIGARQEAGRLGGIGSCGRELCCSTWLTDFRSVSTSAARYQQLSINPLKLAGQCGKLKCCLNYELDSYVDAIKAFPDSNIKLETGQGRAYHQKSDIFKGVMWYNYAEDPAKFFCLSVERVHEIIDMNKKGEKPADLKDYVEVFETAADKEPDIENVVGQDSLTRFDKENNKRKKGGNKGKRKPNQQGKPKARQGGGNKPSKGAEGNSNKPKGPKKPRPKNQGSGNNPKAATGGGGNKKRPNNNRNRPPRNKSGNNNNA